VHPKELGDSELDRNTKTVLRMHIT